jgi:anthranilate 1,2-dioxygenase large subunit/terephthalate 1,2-dioxygenase oxygenase component alpha subunit
VHGPRKLKLETLAGLVFGTLSAEAPPLEQYLGGEIVARIRRVMRAPVKLLGDYSQTLPSNWKLYMENVKDAYHASLLHTFFTTFRLNRLSQQGGIVVSDSGGHHVSYSLAADSGGQEYEQAGMRAAQEGFGLEAPQLLEAVDEFGDGIGLQILSVFPSFVLQQTRNSLAVRRLVPQGLDKTELVWTCFGFASDDAEMTERRLRQANLIGPAGYISMEDGAAPGFVQRAVATAADVLSVVEMGGASVASDDNRVTEAAVRGFWKAYRGYMGI